MNHIVKKRKHDQCKELKNLDLEHLFYNIEIPLMRVLHNMERQGIKINTESLRNFSERYPNKGLIF